MTLETPKGLLRHVAARDIPDSYDAWPAVQARLSTKRTTWQWGLSAAAAVSVILVGMTVLVTSTSQPVLSAELILDRAGVIGEGATSAQRTFHIISTTTLHPGNPSNGAPMVQHEETWSGGSGRMRQETRTPDYASTIINDGAHAWWTITLGAQTYAAPADGIRFSDTAQLNPLAAEGTSIGGLLSEIRQRGCGVAELRGDGTVAGRATYVVTVVHTLAQYCGDTLQVIAEARPSPSTAADARAMATKEAFARTQTGPEKRPNPAAAEASPNPAVVDKARGEVKQAELSPVMSTPITDTLWIDKETFVLLKADQTGNPKGARTYEVTSITYDTAIAPSVFQYAPPAGARVLEDPGAIKRALSTALSK